MFPVLFVYFYLDNIRVKKKKPKSQPYKNTPDGRALWIKKQNQYWKQYNLIDSILFTKIKYMQLYKAISKGNFIPGSSWCVNKFWVFLDPHLKIPLMKTNYTM